MTTKATATGAKPMTYYTKADGYDLCGLIEASFKIEVDWGDDGPDRSANLTVRE